MAELSAEPVQAVQETATALSIHQVATQFVQVLLPLDPYTVGPSKM